MIIKADIVGVTGYTGQELLDILLRHPDVRVRNVYATSDEPKAVAALFPRFRSRTDLVCRKFDVREVCSGETSVVFLALPHTTAMDVVPALMKAGKNVIDLSADYRFRDIRVYEKAYGLKHKDKTHALKAVYGLPELCKQKIRKAQLIANPGCYPTASILGIAPLLATGYIAPSDIIIDAKSGTSGAGKKAVQDMLFTEVDEDFKAYKVNQHQHMPEIAQILSRLAGRKAGVTFVPHLLPLRRGILATVYASACRHLTTAAAVRLYAKFYKDEPFVRVRPEGDFPKLKDVANTNFCDIGVRVDGNRVIAISAIDNLVKGASGQAVQNMNIRFGFPQTAGLL